MATQEHIRPTPLIRNRYDWGEFWYGSKAAILEAAGLSADIAFPGEPGGAKAAFTLRDQLGLALHIRPAKSYEAGPFCVRRPFRNEGAEAQARRAVRTSLLPHGVKLFRGEFGTDTYTGSADALVALGLAQAHEFPGQPGRGKMRVTYRGDGSQVQKGERAGVWDRLHSNPGFRIISKVSGKSFSIEIEVSQSEKAARVRERKEWEIERARLNAKASAHVCTLEMQAGIRSGTAIDGRIFGWPVRAVVLPEGRATPRKRGHLSLVWSK